jgi:hypothetical protein
MKQVSSKASNNVADILAADSGDESLAKYKASLLGAAATGDLGDVNDKRKLVVTEFRVIFEDDKAPDAVFDLSTEVFIYIGFFLVFFFKSFLCIVFLAYFSLTPSFWRHMCFVF